MAGVAVVLRSTTNHAAAWGPVIPVRAHNLYFTYFMETKMHPHIDSSDAILAFTSQLLMGSLWFLRFKECFFFKIEASTGQFDIRLIET